MHPQSIVHAFVEFGDGSVLAQLGFPTMELPILYALTHPVRLPDSGVPRFDPVAAGPLTFEPVRADVFRDLRGGRGGGPRRWHRPGGLQRGQRGGGRGLPRRVGFRSAGLPTRSKPCSTAHVVQPAAALDAVREADRWARARAPRGDVVSALQTTRRP